MIATKIRVVALPAAPILVLDVVVLLTLGGFLVPLFDTAPLLAIVFFLLLRLFFFFLLPLLPLWYALHVYFAAKNKAGLTFSTEVGAVSAFLAISLGWNWPWAVLLILLPPVLIWVPWAAKVLLQTQPPESP
ncbi:MAG: hypothetical protein AUI93_04460 [Crenarchaeota archaeon 13_1_40CM_3_52_10]|nr:MAG: hypothetical protein AUI93_04460 [Crenarchaeota archaeon 13_1_40CM_3_52_10]